MPPRPQHRLSGGRNYRRVVETQQNDATGTGTGSSGTSSTQSFLVREEDGTSLLVLEEGTFFLLKEESS